MLISRIAEHTKNVEADPRSSLLVHANAADIQAAARLTLIGQCRRVAASDDLSGRYVRLLPATAELLQLDFEFYRIEPVAIRYIGGFGSIHWLSPAAFLSMDRGLQGQEEALLRHINATRQPDLRSLYRHSRGVEPRAVQAVALDVDGIDLRDHGDPVLRLAFAAPLESIEQLDPAIDALTRVQ